MNACFMGLGYIGLPTSIIAAKHGINVCGVDINTEVVKITNQGKLHIIEPGLEEMLQEVIVTGHFKAICTSREEFSVNLHISAVRAFVLCNVP